MIVLGTLLVSPIAALGQSGSSAKEPTGYKATIEGLVRDADCPLQNRKSTATEFNLDCTLVCVKSGSPLVILTKSGVMYFQVPEEMGDPKARERLMPFVGKYVRATGTVYRRNGTRAIMIKDITEMKGVKLNPKAGTDE
jgi:hypothetical protein